MSEEKTTIKEPLASLQQRIIAYIIDALIVSAIVTVAFLIPIVIAIVNTFVGSSILGLINSLLWAVLSIAAAAASLYYFIFWPVKHEGQTFGKKFQKIRIMVVEDLDKGKIRPMGEDDLKISLLRYLFGIVDGLPAAFLLGIYFISQSPNNQRFADQQVGTVVTVVPE